MTTPTPGSRRLSVAALCFAASMPFASLAHGAAATLPAGFVDDRMAGSLNQPTGLALIPEPASAGGPRVLFVEQRTARVGLIVGASVTTVGTVPGVASLENERGLLGVAVDPRWPLMPYIYIHCTDGRSGNHVAISRFTVTGDLGFTGSGLLQFSAVSRYDLLSQLPDDQDNHNGGTVRFGPDQRLYVSLGDDATDCGAQDPSLLVGKILRLDVSRLPAGPGGPPPIALLIPPGNPFPALADSNSKLVWALGLRNPFRFHIDPANGRLLIGDVGEAAWEELDIMSAGGPNLGWPMLEGPAPYMTCAGNPALMAPIYSYDHVTGQIIIGAGIYRRPASGARRFAFDYDGDAFFLDYSSGFMRRLNQSGGTWSIAGAAPGQPSPVNWATDLKQVSDVIQAPDGSLWYCRQAINYAASTGEIRRIGSIATTAVEPGDASGIRLAPPFPVPSRGPVALAWTQPAAASVRLVIFDASGRVVRTLADGAATEAGSHQRTWDGRSDAGDTAAPGLYFVKLRVGGVSRTGRVALLR